MGTEGNLNFSEITKGTDFENIIQIQPQLANIILRKGKDYKAILK